VSVASRTSLATIYPYAVSNDGGYKTSGYGAARGTFFCRFSPRVGSETTTQGQAEHRESAVFEFYDLVTVEPNDLIVHDDKQWKVAAPPTTRTTRRAIIVQAIRTDDTPDRSAV